VEFDKGTYDNMSAPVSGTLIAGKTYKIKIVAYINSIGVYVDGVWVFGVPEPTITKGTIALYSHNNRGTTFDNVCVTGL
jgi:hypothetical protein